MLLLLPLPPQNILSWRQRHGWMFHISWVPSTIDGVSFGPTSPPRSLLYTTCSLVSPSPPLYVICRGSGDGGRWMQFSAVDFVVGNSLPGNSAPVYFSCFCFWIIPKYFLKASLSYWHHLLISKLINNNTHHIIVLLSWWHCALCIACLFRISCNLVYLP